MRLLELTSAEIAFLTAHPATPDPLQARLTRKLAATLGARLRLPVQAAARVPAAAAGGAPATPDWQPDAALATLWLTCRLGGRRPGAAAPFVPRSLLRTLDTILAECWLDTAVTPTLPPALAWHITTDPVLATLAVQLPSHTTDMTRWAREVIRHG